MATTRQLKRLYPEKFIGGDPEEWRRAERPDKDQREAAHNAEFARIGEKARAMARARHLAREDVVAYLKRSLAQLNMTFSSGLPWGGGSFGHNPFQIGEEIRDGIAEAMTPLFEKRGWRQLFGPEL